MRGGATAFAAALVVAAVFSVGAQAAPGDLDLTFSGDGKQRTDFGFSFSRAAATVRQPDGRIVAVGDTDGTGNDFALARYNANGSPDASFAGDGRQTTDFGGSERATGVALQANGKIVVVGGDFNDFALARYNPNGSLDTNFSGDGKQTTDFGTPVEGANGVAIQGNGKIVAVGVFGGFGEGDLGDFALARYNQNGSLDASFSGDGRQTTNFGGFDEANGVAIQGNGKIVAVGHTDLQDFALARYNPNGSPDASFSGDGRQTTNFGGSDQATGVALQANGKIVVVGEGGDNDFVLARYNPNGSPDASFSGDGRQTTDFAGGDFGEGANGVAIQGDGKIVAVGVGGGVGDFANDFALARYNPNGSLDPSFSGDGRQTTNFGGGSVSEGANGVALQGGKIVAVGGGGATSDDFALARYAPNGSLDPSFSGDGKQTTGFGGFDQANGVAHQGAKIVAVGNAGSGIFVDFALARYNPNGSLDPSFSGDGRQTTDFTGEVDEANAVALQSDGKIIAVGSTGRPFGHGADIDFALARYNRNGSLDPSFSGDGKQATESVGGNFVAASAVALQGDGKIVVVGRVEGGFALARYNPNGSLDPSFSGDGKQRTDFAGGGTGANGVAIQGDGKIVVVGGSGGGFSLARYNPNGSLDPSFSGDGKQTTNFEGFDEANGVALQANGKIVAVGQGGGGGFVDFALARYNPNGSLDASFSDDGRQRTDFGSAEFAKGVALQGGKIVAAGLTSDGTVGDFALARYNPNGRLDPSFARDGRKTTDFGGDDYATGVALQGGNIVAAGAGLGTDGTSDFALARFQGG